MESVFILNEVQLLHGLKQKQSNFSLSIEKNWLI